MVSNIFVKVQVQSLAAIEELSNVITCDLAYGLKVPLRLLVFVHKERSHALEELGMVEKAGCHLELHLEAFFDVHLRATL